MSNAGFLPNRKQLIALSQLMLVVWIAAFFFRLRLVESDTARTEFSSLAALNSLSNLPIHREFAILAEEPIDFSLEAHRQIQKSLSEWLAKKQLAIDGKHRDARQQVVEWLIGQGVPEYVLKEASGKLHGETIPFLFFHTPLEKRSRRYHGEADVLVNAHVGLLLDEVNYWGLAKSFKVVTAVNLDDLPKLDINLASPPGRPFDLPGTLSFAPGAVPPLELSGPAPVDPSGLPARPNNALPVNPIGAPPFDPSGGIPIDSTSPQGSRSGPRYTLKHVRLVDGDQVAVVFGDELSPIEQRSHVDRVITFQVTTTEIELPWIDLLGQQLQNDSLVEVAKDDALRSKLDNTYGNIQIKQALDITSRRMLETYGNVKLLGFDFTPTTFWMFVVAFYAIFLGAIAIQLKHPYGEQKDEATIFGLHLFLDSLPARIILWIIVPATALLLIVPDRNAGGFGNLSYWVGVILVCLIGAAVTRLSETIKLKGAIPTN